MKNFIQIGNKQIEISDEIANNLKQQFSDKIEIDGEFTWYKEKNKDLDFSKIKNIADSANLQGCSSDMPSLKSIGGFAELRGCSSDLSSLKSIGSFADLRGCSSDMPSLKSIGSSADLRGCSSDLFSLESIGGSAYLQGCSSDLSSLKSIADSANLQGCSKEFVKSLAKTLKKCGNIYIEFKDEPLTLEKFKEYADKL